MDILGCRNHSAQPGPVFSFGAREVRRNATTGEPQGTKRHEAMIKREQAKRHHAS
jgi:hypothetical protein